MSRIGKMILESSSAENVAPEDGLILGKALAMDHRRVVVARDLSRGSPMMADAVISGLLFQGADVIDAGALSAPVAAMYSSKGDCAVYVSGGCGLAEGYHLVNPDGSVFRDEQIRRLDRVLRAPPAPPSHEGLGTYSVRDGIVEEYSRRIVEGLGDGLECSVVLDCGCGTASDILPRILNGSGAEVLAINSQKDPNHLYQQDEEGPDSLESIVADSTGSIGIHVDGTGTSIEVIDENGRAVSDDRLFAMLVLYLRPASIAVPLSVTSLITDAFKGDAGADVNTPREPPPDDRSPTFTEDSLSAVCQAVKEGAVLGYRDGIIVFGDGPAVGDGIKAAVAVALMAGSNSLRGLADSFPSYMREEKEVACGLRAEDFKRAFEEHIGGLADRCSRYGDGYRVSMDDGWFVVRHAAREEDTVLEIVAESRDRAYLAGLIEMADNLVDETLRDARRRYTTSSSIGSP